jgi:uncharacterized protein (TIGR02996 family)
VSALARILEDPDDDGARAVYADELVERGDPRGEFIQVQLALERADPESDEHPKLLERSDRLLAEHGAAWFGPPSNERLRIRRGFVEALDPIPLEATERFDELAAREPITEVELDEPPPRSAALRRLRELRLGDTMTADLLHALPRTIRRLSGWLDLDEDAVDELERLRLEALDVTLFETPPYDEKRAFIQNNVGRIWRLPVVALRLVANVEIALDGFFGGRRLDLHHDRLPELLGGDLDQLTTMGYGLTALLAWPGLERLSRLAFHAFWPTEALRLTGVKLEGLRDLELAHDLQPLGGKELAAMAKAPWAARLRVLRLHMDVDDPDELVKMAKKMPRLTTLQARGLDADTIRKLRGRRLVRAGDAHRRYTLDWSETAR